MSANYVRKMIGNSQSSMFFGKSVFDSFIFEICKNRTFRGTVTTVYVVLLISYLLKLFIDPDIFTVKSPIVSKGVCYYKRKTYESSWNTFTPAKTYGRMKSNLGLISSRIYLFSNVKEGAVCRRN